MKNNQTNKKWVIEFWDFGEWNILSIGNFNHKQEAISIVEKLNKKTSHENRKAFEGHRFRVRKREIK